MGFFVALAKRARLRRLTFTDELTKYYGMTPEDYTAVRVGMNVSGSIINRSEEHTSELQSQ